ncbi:MAG: hypothetical protein ACE5JX_22005 [Acidobacteriota bacterium]
MSGCRVLGAILVAAALGLCSAFAAQLPPHALVYLETLARFRGEPASVQVVFYEVRYQEGRDSYGVGVSVRQPDGQEIARATDDQTGLGLYEGTGIYDVTGDGWPEVIMIGVAGAKTLEATIYEYRSGRLREIRRWSGWRVRVITLGEQPVVAYTPSQYGSLAELYVWQGEKFIESSGQFPEFYGPDIDLQEWILSHPDGFPVYVILQACELGARALVYGKKYSEARQLCLKALEVARSSPGLIASQIGAPPEVLRADRNKAERRIQKTLERISKAREQGRSRLPD